METKNGKNGKLTAFVELVGYFLFVMWCAYVMYAIDTGGFWLGALLYFVQFVVTVFLVMKVDKQPVLAIRLKKQWFWDLPPGLLLGCGLFTVQQLPLVLLGADYSPS